VINHVLIGYTSSSSLSRSRPEDADARDCQVAIFKKDEVAVSFRKVMLTEC